MLNDIFFQEFVGRWLTDWNSHDLERILSHYDDHFEFSSPVLARVSPASDGRLKGKEAARMYWSRGLVARPDLHFELIALLKGVNTAIIHYRGLDNKLCAEFFVFNSQGKIVISHAHGE
ncbi:nuclear transport factor 2 family protein [Undibacterium sp. TS12]|uniref:nuclear transport factor 2 family protein n=1 Tax=Undibacterium sp. TS12 TaxID=2908202 RepID=UPI001F4CBC73|nr:nuclear transport factor 2 family protein [Undibacterium sp. TS12]MCH8622223.1 nuclear transport factor 2 family protein [Undibacterium sp. TS12]